MISGKESLSLAFYTLSHSVTGFLSTKSLSHWLSIHYVTDFLSTKSLYFPSCYFCSHTSTRIYACTIIYSFFVSAFSFFMQTPWRAAVVLLSSITVQPPSSTIFLTIREAAVGIGSWIRGHDDGLISQLVNECWLVTHWIHPCVVVSIGSFVCRIQLSQSAFLRSCGSSLHEYLSCVFAVNAFVSCD